MTNKPRILIVDDVSSNIHLLMSILKEKYSIIAATSGEKALQLAKTNPKPDLILTDIVMPDMDGYDVCKELKNDAETSHIPVIFVTSLNSIAEQEKGLKVGAVDFITKPFSKDIVLHKVNTFLALETLKTAPIENQIEVISVCEKKQTILVVDDSPENIQVIIEVLRDDYIVSVATSAKKSLEMIEDGLTPDLILLDVIMPEMDGYELCEVLKRKEQFKNIPVIFVTILENEKDIVRGFELGAVDYAIKPVEPTVLRARINTHLKLKKYQDSLVEDIKVKNELIFNQSKLAILGEMFENITHQWKQPLSSISVATSGIKIQREFGKLNDEMLENGIETIESSVKYLSHTIDDFKNFLVNDALKHDFNIKEIIEKTVRLMDPKLRDCHIMVESDIQDIIVTNYQNDLIQILMNILSNALDALLNIKGERKIWIKTIENNEHFVIIIKDNAGGIDPEYIEKVFEKYFTTKNEQDGSGIGLFMSQKIAQERLGGEIKAFNIDNGACFEIVIPK